MIRPFTALCMVASLGSILYMYQAKLRSEVQGRQIMQTIADTRAAQQRIAVLKAQYAGLSDDERLIELSDRFLKLKSTQPTQFVQLVDLAARLPAPHADVPDVAPMDEDAVPEAAEQPGPPITPAPHVVSAAARPTPRPAPTQAASQPQPQPQPQAQTQAQSAHAPSVLASVAPVKPAPAPTPMAEPAPVAKARSAPRPPVGAPVYQAAATRPVVSGSALGGYSGGLAAPVPVATSQR